MSGITVHRCGDSLVAIKQATETKARARLHHEAELLAQCDHPGVVRFVDFAEGPPAVLKTAFVGPDSWRTTPATPAGLAALTATVTYLLIYWFERLSFLRLFATPARYGPELQSLFLNAIPYALLMHCGTAFWYA